MAVFHRTDAGVRCALAIQRDAVDTDLTIKLGIHTGPCIAVSSSDYLDYFGSTVNIAARTQDPSLGGDVVVTSLVMRAPGVREVVDDMKAHESSFHATLRGLESMFELRRLVLDRPGDTLWTAWGRGRRPRGEDRSPWPTGGIRTSPLARPGGTPPNRFRTSILALHRARRGVRVDV